VGSSRLLAPVLLGPRYTVSLYLVLLAAALDKFQLLLAVSLNPFTQQPDHHVVQAAIVLDG
jgi:hypothetical protein